MTNKIYWDIYQVILHEVEGVDPINKAIRLGNSAWYVYLDYRAWYEVEILDYLNSLNIKLQ